jgi:hypothetical protein
MAQIVDYQSLTQAIADFTHRADLATGFYTDYFIQTAQAKICNDIFEQNYGNGIAAMETGYPQWAIAGGTAPVPADWFAPKSFQVADGGGGLYPLTFKTVTWLYDNYPQRQAEGLPAYIARDNWPLVTLYGTISSLYTPATLTVITDMNHTAPNGTIQVGAPIDDTTGLIINPCVITAQTSGTTGGVGTYSLQSATGVLQAVQSTEAITAGGPVFVFGPFPDSAYTVSGTYYSKGVALSATNSTNWLVQQCPEVLHAYSMIEAGKFLRDTAMQEMWSGVAEDFLTTLLERDKAERFAAATMAIELG